MKGSRKRFEDPELYFTWDDDYYRPCFIKFYKAVIDYVIAQFKPIPGDMILDAGCGPAVHTIQFSKRGYKCLSLDFSSTALSEAKVRIQKEGLTGYNKFACADLTRLSFRDESFSNVFCWGVIMHIPNPEKAIDELSRILKRGGYLALSISNANSLDQFLIRKIAYKVKTPRSLKKLGVSEWGRYTVFEEKEGELFVQGLFVNKIKKRFESNGLRIVACIGTQPSQLYSILKSELLKKVFAYLNLFWLKYVRIPYLCSDQLLIITKQ